MSWSQILDNPIYANLLSNSIWVVLGLLWWFLNGRLRRVARFTTLSPLTKWFIVAAIALAIVAANQLLVPGSAFIGLVVSCAFLVAAGTYMLRPYADAGIYLIADSPAKGISYEQSLKLVESSFDFLGVGADKLTKSSQFKEAVTRASRGSSSVRFLLSPPENPILKATASRAGKEQEAYEARVLESLGRLATYKIREGYNIEVRFYPVSSEADYQQFRLMFIDDKICVLSFTVWDSGDGTSNPQIVLHARSGARNRQLMSAFKDHFQRVWDEAEKVDLQRFLR
tara:strand:+ start:1183 stop:2034 length:852 start_codon:yes stop_codon:yes gene_type:complete